MWGPEKMFFTHKNVITKIYDSFIFSIKTFVGKLNSISLLLMLSYFIRVYARRQIFNVAY